MSHLMQKTINAPIGCFGVGIHSGKNVKMTLRPAVADSGIIFHRTDIGGVNGIVKADFRNVVDTNLGTTIANEFGTKISTIEHLMAAIWGCEIDNLIIELNGSEVPIMDGSSEPFVFLLECAGRTILNKNKKMIEIMQDVTVTDGDKEVTLSKANSFEVDLEIDFNHKQIRKQNYHFDLDKKSFKTDICRARTFGFKHEIDYLHKMGLAKGGSLDNAIVIDDEGVVNKEGLRYNDEFVRHKTLDLIGDVYLAGATILGKFKAKKSGHGINNKILHQIFNDPNCYRVVA